MRDENAILATRIEIERTGDDGPVVVLDGERRVPLDPQDPRTPGHLDVLEELRDQRRPVYVEVDPETGTLARLLLPLPTRVVQLEERNDDVLVELAGSHAVHRVDLGRDDADDLVASLRAAGESRGEVLVIEDEAHQVIDLVELTPGPDGPVVPPFPTWPTPEPGPLPFWRWFWGWFWDRFWILLWWWRCPSAAAAQTIFDQLGATTCPPTTAAAPCIPFMYPDDGCWARAHEMCRLMLNLGRLPRKVWIRRGPQGPLQVKTRNNPFCQVSWWWHVAPTLCVRVGPWWWPFITQRMVMDPSMFTTPVPVATWQAACTDPSSTLEHTGPEQYWPSGGTDPTYSGTNADLATYRTALRNRSLGPSGPPPYSHC